MGNQSTGQVIQRMMTIVVVLSFFLMPFIMFSIKTVGMDIPTVAISMSGLDLSNGFSVKPLGFPIYLIDWSAPNGIFWVLILPAIYGWFAIDVQGDNRRRELGIGAILTVLALAVIIVVAFSISSVNAKIEDSIATDGDGLNRIGLSFIVDALNNNKTRLTIELSYGWWVSLIAYVLMGLNLLRQLTFAGSQIVQVARGSMANVASGVASVLSPSTPMTATTTQPMNMASGSGAQSLEQKLERLRKLHESGAISDAEYDLTRQQYLSEI
jgi:hypothetical protein